MTVALGTNIANPISTALSQWLGFDAMGKLANYGKLGVTDPDAVITALFANGEQGAWYDPSDLSTMFQDRAGTTPVTADGQTVGAILDKSKGLVLGSELVTNGDFSNGSTSWTLSDGVTVSSGVCLFSAVSGINSGCVQTGIIQNVKAYQITYTINSISGGSVAPFFAGNIGVYRSAAGTYYETVISDANTNNFGIIRVSGTVTAEIDNISVKEISGNPAVAQSDASRPLYKTDDVYHWLQLDGSNDALITASFAWVTNKATATVGVLQNNSSDLGQIFTFGSNPIADEGAFGSYVNVAANGDYSMGAKGTAQCLLRTPGATIPRSDVATFTYDLSQTLYSDSLKLRLNGSEQSLTLVAGGNLGGGNFGTHSLYIGQRGDGGFSFLGNVYGIIIRGALSTTQEISDTETWMVKKKVAVDAYGIEPTSFSDSLAVVDKSTYLETSSFAQVIFDTSATEFEVISYSSIYGLYENLAEIGVYVDGVFNQRIQHSGDGWDTNSFTLSAGVKRVSLVNGAQSQLFPIKGTFLHYVHANATVTQVFPTVTDRIYIYGDSIAVGANCVYSQENAWAMKLRRYRGTDSTMVDAQGYRALSNDASDGTARTAFVAKVVSANPAILWMAIGLNDYGLPTTNAADFGSDYAALLDALHTALPSLIIYCQTPIVRTSEAANSFGNTLGDYRSQISTAVSTRTGYCTLVDGTALLSTSDLDDGIHPTDAGHGVYYAAVKTVLGI